MVARLGARARRVVITLQAPPSQHKEARRRSLVRHPRSLVVIMVRHSPVPHLPSQERPVTGVEDQEGLEGRLPRSLERAAGMEVDTEGRTEARPTGGLLMVDLLSLSAFPVRIRTSLIIPGNTHPREDTLRTAIMGGHRRSLGHLVGGKGG